MMHAAGVGRGALRIGPPLLVGEDGDQATVAGVEVEMALGRPVEVRLLEHERHPEDAFPEVDRGLPVGPHDRDVVDTLALKLAHWPSPLYWRSTSLDLYSLRCKVPHATRSTRVWTTRALRSRSRIDSASAGSAAQPRASSTLTGSGGSCLTPGPCGL